VSAGRREDRSGHALTEWAGGSGHRVVHQDVVPDETVAISARLAAWADSGEVDLVVTTGGTGFTVRDVTPEATSAILERLAPGIPEAIRSRGASGHAFAWLARGVAGIRGRTLIVNLPGSEGGVRDGIAVLDGLVGHAIQLLRGDRTDMHPAAHG
jgi:molybdenum cofactor synthesis domain-containing protein